MVRRHVRHCGACQAYRNGLRADAKALRALAPVPAGGLVGGAGALIGATAKGVLAGGALTQAGAACAVSICSVGGSCCSLHIWCRTRFTTSVGRPLITGWRPSGGGRRRLAAGARRQWSPDRWRRLYGDC
ncbi:MAG TPA: hypothetical protein VG371_03265 [Solirubrobacteraceae bacterium]|nr:hypothetical protein [Solirubrobacteraceae bacterium]